MTAVSGAGTRQLTGLAPRADDVATTRRNSEAACSISPCLPIENGRQVVARFGAVPGWKFFKDHPWKVDPEPNKSLPGNIS